MLDELLTPDSLGLGDSVSLVLSLYSLVTIILRRSLKGNIVSHIRYMFLCNLAQYNLHSFFFILGQEILNLQGHFMSNYAVCS